MVTARIDLVILFRSIKLLDWSIGVSKEIYLCLKSRKMILNPRILSSAAAVAITCAVSAAAYYYKSRNTEINEVMVFCKLQFNAYNYFDKLISYVEAAKKSVNVCMPSIHNPAIQGRLVTLIRKRKIQVRIIIDRSGYNESTDFFIKELIEAGKFVLNIDCIIYCVALQR